MLTGIDIFICSSWQYFKSNFSFVIGLYISYSIDGAKYPSISISNLNINKGTSDEILYNKYFMFF